MRGLGAGRTHFDSVHSALGQGLEVAWGEVQVLESQGRVGRIFPSNLAGYMLGYGSVGGVCVRRWVNFRGCDRRRCSRMDR